MTQCDAFTVKSELEPIFDAFRDGFGRFETLESDFMVHLRGRGVIVRNVENDGLVRLE